MSPPEAGRTSQEQTPASEGDSIVVPHQFPTETDRVSATNSPGEAAKIRIDLADGIESLDAATTSVGGVQDSAENKTNGDDTTGNDTHPPSAGASASTAPVISEKSRSAPMGSMGQEKSRIGTHGKQAEGGQDSVSPVLDQVDAESTQDSKPEIKTIMEQFKDEQGQESPVDAKTPTGSTLPVFHYPPRMSSLEHRRSGSASTIDAPERSNTMSSPTTVSQPPLPEPDPEPDLPFDFHRFLEQLRHRTADPVARFLRSFLQEFGKKQWMVHEQVKIINDFLTFIASRMAQCEVWRTVSEAEFDNAKEGMEKLVMNRLYTQTFSPEIPQAEPLKGRKKNAVAPLITGRRGQHQEDVERDEVLAQKVQIYGWIKEEHLDVKPFSDKGRRFLTLAQQELSKIKSYRAPRDKVICVLNSCKVLFGFLRNAQSEQSADAFIPLLIYTVLKANPDHLVSNLQYILRFRNQEKLGGEAGYYMSSLMGAVQFIENLDRTSLTVSDEDFERYVEESVSAIAEQQSREEKRGSSGPLPFNEKSTPSRAEVTPRHSLEGEHVSPRRKASLAGPSHGTESPAPEDSDDNAAVAGLLRTIQKPLSTIGRIFSDEPGPASGSPSDRPALTPQPGATPRMSPLPSRPGTNPSMAPPAAGDMPPGAGAQVLRGKVAAEDAAARQASAETVESHRIDRAQHQTVVETLAGMFPDLDRDIISDVVRQKEGRVGLAVDACLALSR